MDCLICSVGDQELFEVIAVSLALILKLLSAFLDGSQQLFDFLGLCCDSLVELLGISVAIWHGTA